MSVFITETRHTALLPSFEKESRFRFEKSEIQELVEMLGKFVEYSRLKLSLLSSLTGILKTDKITRRILNIYKSSNDSLLSILLKELVSSHNSVETRNFATQTEINLQPQSLDLSVISSKSKSKRSKRRKNHGLVNQEFKAKKPKKLKDVAVIAQNLEKMSNNISVITSKLDDFKRNPSQDESKTIIGHVGTIMNTLNGCIGNFETLCRDIKKINDTRSRNYDEWMDDLQNSDNGRRFVRKLQKSFSRVMNEEKSKLQKDFRRKLEREKTKLSKLHRANVVAKKPEPTKEDYFDTIGKEINEIFQNTCLTIKNIEKESELFEASLEMEAKRSDVKAATVRPQVNLNLDECRQIHSRGSSSIKTDPSYNTQSFDSDENN